MASLGRLPIDRVAYRVLPVLSHRSEIRYHCRYHARNLLRRHHKKMIGTSENQKIKLVFSTIIIK